MWIARSDLEQVIQHAREDAPNECCGMFAVGDGKVVRLYPAENIHHSPERFEIEGLLVKRVSEEVEERNETLGIYHSHTKSAAFPSQTDINFAELWPGVVWMIVSLDGPPVTRAFRIDKAHVEEVELTVE